MRVQNTTGVDLYVAALQIVVADGEQIDLDDNLAETLTEQGWKSKPTKAAKATTPDPADEAVTSQEG